MESARSIISYSGLPNSYWAEAVYTVAYLRNRSASSAIKENKTPNEKWYDWKPDLSVWHIWFTESNIRQKCWEVSLCRLLQELQELKIVLDMWHSMNSTLVWAVELLTWSKLQLSYILSGSRSSSSNKASSCSLFIWRKVYSIFAGHHIVCRYNPFIPHILPIFSKFHSCSFAKNIRVNCFVVYLQCNAFSACGGWNNGC